jgi:two-component system cell cycle response regulator
MRGDREKVLDAGFDGYLSKPINAISLAEELERLLGRPGARRAVPAQAANRLYDGKAGPGNPQSNA